MITVAPAGDVDLDQIMTLEAAGFASAEQWSRTSWASQLAGVALPVWLAHDPTGQPVGVVTLRLTGDTADLDRIVVAPEARRRGVARELMDHALTAAAAAGATEMILEVETGNGAAVALYRSLGFADLAVRSDYYGPGQDAQLMKLIMNSAEPIEVGGNG